MQDSRLGGRYRRDRVVGRGAMGEVWIATDELLDRTVAVKTISSTAALTSLATPVRDEQLTRIRREARLAARMNHPNAVVVYDLVTENGQPNVVMEYVPGRTFAEEIRASGALGPLRVAEVGADVAGALAHAHELGITHRDVKPANILITRRGVPKLADFGVAKVTGDAGVTSTGVMLGTPAFVAPEVARGSAADAASDVWSLGATLYAALEGRSPFQQTGTEDAIVVLGRLISQPVPPLRPGPVPDVVMRMLDVDPTRRPSAAHVEALLRDAVRRSADADRTYVPVAAPHRVALDDSSAARWSQPTELRELMAGGGATSATRRRGRSGSTVLIVSAAVVVVAAVVAVAVVLGTRGSSSPSAGGTKATGSDRPPTTTSTTGSSVAPVAPVAPPASAADSGAPVTGGAGPTADATYSAPGGLSVEAPENWVEEDFFQVSRTKQFVDGTDHFADPYLNIGVGNDRPNPDWGTEVENSRTFLTETKKYRDVVVAPAVYQDFRGTTAADIEFTETNAAGVRRHAEERIWEEDGVVYIIQLNTPAGQWAQFSSVFTTMIDSCTVS